MKFYKSNLHDPTIEMKELEGLIIDCQTSKMHTNLYLEQGKDKFIIEIYTSEYEKRSVLIEILPSGKINIKKD